MSKKCPECRQSRKSDDAPEFEKCTACSSKWLYFWRANNWKWYKEHREKVQRQEYLVLGRYGDGT